MRSLKCGLFNVRRAPSAFSPPSGAAALRIKVAIDGGRGSGASDLPGISVASSTNLGDEGPRSADEAVRAIIQAVADILIAVDFGAIEKVAIVPDGGANAFIPPARKSAALHVAIDRCLPVAKNPRHASHESGPPAADGGRDVLRFCAHFLVVPIASWGIWSRFIPLQEERGGDFPHPQIGFRRRDRRRLKIPAPRPREKNDRKLRDGQTGDFKGRLEAITQSSE